MTSNRTLERTVNQGGHTVRAVALLREPVVEAQHHAAVQLNR